MSSLEEFLLDASRSIPLIDAVEFSQPGFTQVYRVQRVKKAGIDFTHEDGNSHFYEYYPLQVVPSRNAEDLDYGVRIALGDLGGIIAKELNAIEGTEHERTKVTLTLRQYRGDDLTRPLAGPFHLECPGFHYNKRSSTFDARARTISNSLTGEIYDPSRFVTLKGVNR